MENNEKWSDQEYYTVKKFLPIFHHYRRKG